MNIGMSYDAYTSNPEYISNKTGKARQRNEEWSTKERVDRASVDATIIKNLFQNNNTNINLKYGGGVSYTGNIGGEKIQNEWHDRVGVNYHVHAPYEKGWWGAHVNLWIDAQKKLNNYIYAWTKVDWRVNFIGRGATHADATLYAWAEGKYAWFEVWASHRLLAKDTSPTIRATQTGQGDVYGYIRAMLGTENFKIVGEITNKDKWSGKGSGSIGVVWRNNF